VRREIELEILYKIQRGVLRYCFISKEIFCKESEIKLIKADILQKLSHFCLNVIDLGRVIYSFQAKFLISFGIFPLSL